MSESEGVRATPRERRDEWKRLADAATEGPWDLDMNKRWGSWKVTAPPSDGHPDYSRKIADSLLTEADAEFIAAAREAVPALAAEVETLSVERDDLRAKLKLCATTLDEVAGVLNDTEAERDSLAAKIEAVEAERDDERRKFQAETLRVSRIFDALDHWRFIADVPDWSSDPHAVLRNCIAEARAAGDHLAPHGPGHESAQCPSRRALSGGGQG